MKKKQIFAEKNLSPQDIDRIIEMAWEDRTPFEAILTQFGLTERETIALMRNELLPKNWRKWRERVHQSNTKHTKTRSEEIDRFKCSRQKSISKNRVSKR